MNKHALHVLLEIDAHEFGDNQEIRKRSDSVRHARMEKEFLWLREHGYIATDSETAMVTAKGLGCIANAVTVNH